MDIKYHDFEKAKNELKSFSEQTITDLDFKRVDNSKGVGEFFGDFLLGRGIGLDHKVTGKELNEVTTQIQNHFHSVNNTQIKLIKEFGKVYDALEALDKDYIQSILVSIEATEKTSQSIQRTQEQISKIIENQKKTLEELKRFKQQLDGYAHLTDIDKIWADCEKIDNQIQLILDKIKNLSEESNKDIVSLKNKEIEREEFLIEYKNHIENMLVKIEKKNKITYFMSGASLGFIILGLVLMTLGVI